jgi:hypothetical protein
MILRKNIALLSPAYRPPEDFSETTFPASKGIDIYDPFLRSKLHEQDY